jgi:transcriptional regulator with XRE-family HTH domain
VSIEILEYAFHACQVGSAARHLHVRAADDQYSADDVSQTFEGSVMDSPRTLGQIIRTRRQELGLTQEELAARIGGGVRQAEVSRLESDRITLPRRQRLERIASALNVTIGELLAGAGWTGANDAFRPQTDVTAPPETLTSRRYRRDGAATNATSELLNGSRLLKLHETIARSQELQRRTAALLHESSQLANDWLNGGHEPRIDRGA